MLVFLVFDALKVILCLDFLAIGLYDTGRRNVAVSSAAATDHFVVTMRPTGLSAGEKKVALNQAEIDLTSEKYKRPRSHQPSSQHSLLLTSIFLLSLRSRLDDPFIHPPTGILLIPFLLSTSAFFFSTCPLCPPPPPLTALPPPRLLLSIASFIHERVRLR